MNKKFSTLLTMGLLMGGSLVSVANAAGEVTLPIGNQVSEFKSNKKYFVVQDNDGTLDATNSFLLGFAKDADVATKVVDASTQLKGTAGSWTSTDVTGTITKLETNSYIWKVTETKEGSGATAKYFYTFTNESTGKKLMLKADKTTLVTNYITSETTGGVSDFTWKLLLISHMLVVRFWLIMVQQLNMVLSWTKLQRLSMLLKAAVFTFTK